MKDLADRITRFSPEKRVLFERLLAAQYRPVNSIVLRRRESEEYPLSFAQERLWFLEQYEPGNIAYNYCDAIRFRGTLNVPALEQSLNEVLRRHEVLRTVFVPDNDSVVQRVLPSQPIPLPVVDANNVLPLQREDYIRRATLEDAERPFDLERGPLLRLKLLRFEDQDHALIFVTHHIIFDGWSSGVFLRELTQVYGAGEKRSPLPELQIQYGDYAEWQRRSIDGASIDNQMTYWKKQLTDLSTLALPLDHPRPAAQTFNGNHVKLHVTPEVTDALRLLCRSEKATLYMLTLAAFKVLLHRYSGQEDIVVGTPIAGRTLPQFETMIGMFVNMLVLRSNTGGNPTFRELLSRVRATCLGAFVHQEIPFDRLVEALEPERLPDRSPLFQVNFIFQNTPRPNIDIHKMAVSYLGVQPRTSRFDLTLVLTECAGGIEAVMEYNTDLFEGATIQRMLAHFDMLLRSIALNPDAAIDEIPLLTPAERHEILTTWNATAHRYPKDKAIHALIEEQVERTPNSVAVEFEAESLTYAELNARADALAHQLRESGVGSGVLVGICVDRSIEMIVGVLSILKAGGAYVPMDPHYPADRLTYMMVDTGMPVLLTQANSKFGASALSHVKVLTVDKTGQDRAPKSPNTANGNSANANDVAYCIYTSGSTGKPKGVQIAHRSVVNFLYSMRRMPGICADDVMLSVTSLSFDICGLEIFLPLITGARIRLVSRDETIEGHSLMRRIETSGATIMQATPSLWRLLLDSGWRGKAGLKALCGGEALTTKLADQLLATGVELWNMYGPTETTIWSSLKRIDSVDRINIGRPIANTTMYILNSALQPVPIGVAGELYIGGDGLARAYLNRPELTAERFLPDPISVDPNARMYRTGDQARFLPGGEIQFLGRVDGQVKIRGHRIELGEIETELGRHLDVREAVVVPRDDGSGNKQLVAYVTLNAKAVLDVSAVRKFLEKILPEIMIPKYFVRLESLPRTPNGKVDRNALPELDISSVGASRSDFVAASSNTERALTEIWAEVLKAPHVGVHDNFFALGGHSLLVFQVLSRIRDRLGMEVPVRVVFESATVAKLAEFIDTMRWAATTVEAHGDIVEEI